MSEISIIAEINFHEQEVASIFHETNVAGRDEQFAELCFAGAFAIRMMSNMGVNETTDMIGQQLQWIAHLITDTPDDLLEPKPELIRYPGHPGRRRFIGNLRLSPHRMQMDFKAKGFGLLARGMGYYGPVAVHSVFRYFASRRVDDTEYVTAMASTTAACGQLQLERQIQLSNHAQLQMMLIGSCFADYLPDTFG